MKKFNIDQVEDTNITLDTVKGLAQTINDLLEDNISLFTEYPSTYKGVKGQADRLVTKLLALAKATITATTTAQNQIETVAEDFYKGGDHSCN
ncbi:hypothetical protein [Limosilactobacillus fastidiosus]|uniref:Uncharacterized protein n=1 Tax=Limosilactobacillus fastidiosus TaxID=2759855 RepID=A0A7W3YCZ7_9LACO|nr:hypothetical protein [Limosilactobacillus fastidiosus]MBB1086823.1 hypothetical protein [Limosilactobacillus fastidiosus]MCD7085450.1 hypothetical protein [Limosilactobacillus fastidiosus]MCD7114681.1 hypothetical protein [Limosilactobacillus fastidiosus]MCD7116070.1 hypothetical protein [Limosilactobacillus fastidiosus]